MATGPGPTARALRTLEVLQARPGATAADLAERLGVTERAARRYVGILREAGISVESARGPHGGYRLGRGTRLPPVMFTEAEALGLVMAVLDGEPAAADSDDLVGSALGKVIRALPDSVARQAATLREHASTTPARHSARPDPATTSALVAAVAARQRTLITCRSESGHEWEAAVDPWAVVVRHGRWYLLCHSHRAGGPHLPDRPGPRRPPDRAGVRAARRPRPRSGGGGQPRQRVGLRHPRGLRRPPRGRRTVASSAHGTARTLRNRLRPHREHQ